MAVDGRAIAMGLLLISGFAGGFLLSGEVSRHLALQPASHPSGTGGEGAAAAPPGGAGAAKKGGAGGGAAGGGGSDRRGSGGGRDGPEAGGGAERPDGEEKDGSGREGEGHEPAAAPSGSLSDAGPEGGAVGAAGRPCPSVELAGAAAAAALAGNTAVDDRDGAERAIVYFAPRGLQGRIGPTSIVVRPWDPKAVVLCDARDPATGAKACGPIRVRRCTGETPPATTIGQVLLPSGRWARIVRGNVQSFPDYIPFLDDARPPAAPVASRTASDGKRRAADRFDTAQVYMAPQSDTEPDGRIVYYAPDGRRLDFILPDAGRLRAGVAVALGWWTLDRGLLCEGRGGSGHQGSCYRPKARGDGGFTLLSTARAPQKDLLAVPDAARIRAEDRDG